MRFESFVAFRYLRGKRKNRFISLITIISIAGVSVGVVALIVVIGVMTGFDIALTQTIIGNRAHLFVQEPFGEPIENYEKVAADIESVDSRIVASAPFIQVEALIRVGDANATGAFIIGMDPEPETKVTQVADNLTGKNGRKYGRGALPGYKEIVLGHQLANRIRVGVGDEVTVITDTGKAKATPFGVRPGQELRLTISGISQAQMYEFDNLYGFVDIPTARLLSGRPGVDGIHCRLTDAFLAKPIAEKVESQLLMRTQTWYENQQPFFEALQQEKVVMFIILLFITVVAAFNITSTLIMVVMEKRRDIGVLRTIGVSSGSILRLFVIEGLYIGLSGTVLGVLGGIVLAYNLNPIAVVVANILGVDLYNSQIYYFDRIPVAIVPRDVAIITVCSVVLTFVSTLYPAWSAARLRPVDALRLE
jgi:lipoprotein-releasing system permease protein